MNELTQNSQGPCSPKTKHLKPFNPNKTAQQLLEQVEAWMGREDTCHYFAVQEVGNVVQPFGIGRPFYEIEKANIYVEHLKDQIPDKDYFVTAGALDTSFLNFDDESAEMWYRIWLNKHQFRIIKLQVDKMNVSELSKLACNYEEIIAWQEKNNTKDVCHFYFAQSCNDAERDVGISAQQTTDLHTALAAKLYLEKTIPDRCFKVSCGLMSTEQVMSLDGRTVEMYQDFIEEHKERIARLDAVVSEGA